MGYSLLIDVLHEIKKIGKKMDGKQVQENQFKILIYGKKLIN